MDGLCVILLDLSDLWFRIHGDMKKLLSVVSCVAFVAFLNSCGSKAEEHGNKVKSELSEVVDVVKTLNATEPDKLAAATDDALIKIEKIGTRMKELALASQGIQGFTAEKLKEYEADVAKISKELDLEIEELAKNHPDIAIKVNAKIVEVMSAVEVK